MTTELMRQLLWFIRIMLRYYSSSRVWSEYRQEVMPLET
jgi:hypothetical protein